MNPSDFHNGMCSHCRYEIFDTLTAHVGAAGNGRVRFVQVGANDGQSGSDPIFPYVKAHNWSGALVEPVPYLFERLKKNYAGRSDVQFVQACCGPEEGKQPFYLVDEASENSSLIGPFLSSFDKNVILNHRGLIPNIEDYVREVQIDTLRVDSVIERTGLSDLHILAVDTEGADDLVVQSMDLNKYRPHIVFLEHKHIRFDAVRELIASYTRAGYHPVWMYEDLVFVGPDLWQYEHIRKIASSLESMYRI